MTFLDSKSGEYILEARTQANLSGRCLHCGLTFKQSAELGVYGLTFCGPCIRDAKGTMPTINYPVNEIER